MNSNLREKLLDHVPKSEEFKWLEERAKNNSIYDYTEMYWNLDRRHNILLSSKTNSFLLSPTSRKTHIRTDRAAIIDLDEQMAIIDKDSIYVVSDSKEVSMKKKDIDGNIVCSNCNNYLGGVYNGLLYKQSGVKICYNEVVCEKCGYGNVTYFNYR